MKTAALVALVLTLALPAGAATSGLRGLVTRGPTSPVCREGVSCTAPAKDVLVTFHKTGLTRSVRTGSDGRYRIVLPAGTYAVTLTRAFRFSPRSAVVPAGRMGVRNFAIDTGIR
jgi:hypothetical protein